MFVSWKIRMNYRAFPILKLFFFFLVTPLFNLLQLAVTRNPIGSYSGEVLFNSFRLPFSTEIAVAIAVSSIPRCCLRHDDYHCLFMERTVVEKLDILFESEKDFPCISQALRNFQLLESGAVGKIEGISNERERWHGA